MLESLHTYRAKCNILIIGRQSACDIINQPCLPPPITFNNYLGYSAMQVISSNQWCWTILWKTHHKPALKHAAYLCRTCNVSMSKIFVRKSIGVSKKKCHPKHAETPILKMIYKLVPCDNCVGGKTNLCPCKSVEHAPNTHQSAQPIAHQLI